VCVLGADLGRSFFPHGPAAGNKVRIEGVNFDVIGVLEKRGKFLGLENLDNTVHIPVTRFATGFAFRPGIRVVVKVGGLSKLEDAKEEVRGVMRKVRNLPSIHRRPSSPRSTGWAASSPASDCLSPDFPCLWAALGS
jgi:putative ABC transport system permease protein